MLRSHTFLPSCSGTPTLVLLDLVLLDSVHVVRLLLEDPDKLYCCPPMLLLHLQV